MSSRFLLNELFSAYMYIFFVFYGLTPEIKSLLRYVILSYLTNIVFNASQRLMFIIATFLHICMSASLIRRELDPTSGINRKFVCSLYLESEH